MKSAAKRVLAVLLFNALAEAASAADPALAWIGTLRGVAFSLGWLMMVLMGLKWIISESANERAEAKKGIIYIVVGLLIVTSAKSLLQLYCDTAKQSVSSFECDLSFIK